MNWSFVHCSPWKHFWCCRNDRKHLRKPACPYAPLGPELFLEQDCVASRHSLLVSGSRCSAPAEAVPRQRPRKTRVLFHPPMPLSQAGLCTGRSAVRFCVWGLWGADPLPASAPFPQPSAPTGAHSSEDTVRGLLVCAGLLPPMYISPLTPISPRTHVYTHAAYMCAAIRLPTHLHRRVTHVCAPTQRYPPTHPYMCTPTDIAHTQSPTNPYICVCAHTHPSTHTQLHD